MKTTQLNLRTLNAVCLMASKEETRYYLNGVLIQCRADHVLYVATDGHRMMVVRDNIAEGQVANELLGDFIIPTEICRAYKPRKGRAGIEDVGLLSQDGAELRLQRVGEGASIFKPVDGTFPDYARVIPTELTGLTDWTEKGAKEATGIAFNPAYVSDFAKFGEVMECGKPWLAYNSGAPAAVIYTDAPHVLGVLMPIHAFNQSELKAKHAERLAFILAAPKVEQVEQLQAAE